MRWIPEAMKSLIRHPHTGIVQGSTLECFHKFCSRFELPKMDCIL